MTKKTIVKIILLCLMFTMASTVYTFGASASLSISGGGSYTVGSTVKITYTFSASNIAGASAQIVYDSSVLKYTGCSGGTAPSTAAGVINVYSGDGNAHSSLSVTISFKALKAGSSKVTVSPGGDEGIIDYDGNPLSVSSKSTTVSVTNPSSSVSSNANLSSLKVSAGSLSPAFSPSTTSYTVNVGENVTVCTVSATPQDSGATVSVSGSKNLSVGKNVRTVTVTAENGTKKSYTITIYRSSSSAAEQPDSSGNDDGDKEEDNNQDKPASEIKVTVGDKEYILQENYDENSVPDGFVMTVAKYEDNDIPVIKDANLKYTFALLKDPDTGDEKWFFYDEKNDTFSETSKLSADEAIEYAALLSQKDDKDDSDRGFFDIFDSREKILVIALGATIVILIAAVIALQVGVIRKYRKKTGINLREDLGERDDY